MAYTQRLILFLSIPLLLFSPKAFAGADGEGDAAIAFTDIEGKTVVGSRISVRAGARGAWSVIYTVGPNGLDTGAGLRITRAQTSGLHLGILKQNTNPLGDDYVRADAEPANAGVEITHLARDPRDPIAVEVRLATGTLSLLDRIRIHIGFRSFGEPGSIAPPHARENFRVFVETDGNADGLYSPLPRVPRVDVIPATTVNFELVGPTEAVAGEPFHLLLRAEGSNQNVDMNFFGKVLLSCSDETAEFQREMLLTPLENGIASVRVVLNSEGTHTFKAVSIAPAPAPAESPVPPIPILGKSNPIHCRKEAPPRRILWGDLRVRTDASDGLGSPGENLIFAREIAGLDFCAITDPYPALEESPDANEPSYADFVKERWQEAVSREKRYDDPPDFAVMPGAEWISADQSSLVLYADWSVPLVLPASLPSDALPVLTQSDYPSFPNRPGTGEVALLEVCSSHGRFEWLLQEALGRGLRIAVIGTGNGVIGRPGNFVWQIDESRTGGQLDIPIYAFPNALTGVYAEESSRPAILAALREGRCYATTGARLRVSFEGNGNPMGSAYNTEKPPRFQWEVDGTVYLERIELIRGDRLVHTQSGSASVSLTGSYEDPDCPGVPSPYYLRVRQMDGELAWTSPIWVSRTGGNLPVDIFHADQTEVEVKGGPGTTVPVMLRVPEEELPPAWKEQPLHLEAQYSGVLNSGDAQISFCGVRQTLEPCARDEWKELRMFIPSARFPPGTNAVLLQISRSAEGNASYRVRELHLALGTPAAARESAWNADDRLEVLQARYAENREQDYTEELMAFLKEHSGGRIYGLTQIRALITRGGQCIEFVGSLEPEDARPVNLRYFRDFFVPRIQISDGCADYGPRPPAHD